MTILVVEDTELLRRMYSDSLTQAGYCVVTAGDGLEALAALRGDPPDLILLDLIMPKMSGLEVLDIVKKDPRLRSIPVLILSNLGQDTDMQKGLAMGAVDYLIKNDVRPVDIAEKIATVLKIRGAHERSPSYRLYVRDREADADLLVREAGLARRFWCPACEIELQLVLVPHVNRPGWYDSHFECPACGREY